MKNLKAYIDQKNIWGACFGSEPLTLPQDAARIRNSLEADLSPENLTCDGEASPAFVRKQYQFLTAALAELESAYAV